MTYTVNLSGGKDSTAMLLMMLERLEPIDEVVFFDTGWEFPEMYEHLNLLEKNIGMPITRLKPDKSFDYWMLYHEITRGKRKGARGYGFARPNARWCTTIKTNTIDKYLKGRNTIRCLGIASDEVKRAKPRESFRYPLVEWGITESEALEYCYNRGYSWSGLYEKFDRVSCWCCPLKRIGELRNLKKYYPELWDELLEMESKSSNRFRCDYSASELDKRFENDIRIMRGRGVQTP